jgi:hypothetical protein
MKKKSSFVVGASVLEGTINNWVVRISVGGVWTNLDRQRLRIRDLANLLICQKALEFVLYDRFCERDAKRYKIKPVTPEAFVEIQKFLRENPDIFGGKKITPRSEYVTSNQSGTYSPEEIFSVA